MSLTSAAPPISEAGGRGETVIRDHGVVLGIKGLWYSTLLAIVTTVAIVVVVFNAICTGVLVLDHEGLVDDTPSWLPTIAVPHDL